jgi:hypothetical protein
MYRATFTLPMVTPLLNVTLRTHFRDAKRLQARMSGLLRMASQGRRPATPLQRARVTIERRSTGTPDQDNLVGGVKQLVDVLLVPQVLGVRGRKVRHALGLSFVVDDAPAHLELVVRSVKVKRADQCTVITVEEL